METTNLGFTVAYKVDQITAIKPSPSGEYQGRNYEASVKFRSTNLVTKDDPELGLIDVETHIEFSIPCADRDLRKLNLYLRNLSKEHKSITIYGGIASRNDNKSIYSVKSLATGQEIMTTTEQSKTTKN